MALHENERDIFELINTTEIDRVLRLKAWNGLEATKYVTAYVQFREEDQRLIKYAHWPTDGDYNDRLYKTRREGSFFFRVDDENPLAKIIANYKAEGLRCSLWVHAVVVKLIGSDSHCIIFMSYGSHTTDTLSPATIALCEGITERYADMVRRWHTIHPETEVVE